MTLQLNEFRLLLSSQLDEMLDEIQKDSLRSALRFRSLMHLLHLSGKFGRSRGHGRQVRSAAEKKKLVSDTSMLTMVSDNSTSRPNLAGADRQLLVPVIGRKKPEERPTRLGLTTDSISAESVAQALLCKQE